MSELKPCPFCGSHNLVEGYHSPFVICDDCGAFGPGHADMTHDEAIAAWNSRAERTCKLMRHGSLANMPSFICWSCSECGFGWHHSENDRQFSYCPNCGCKVVKS